MIIWRDRHKAGGRHRCAGHVVLCGSPRAAETSASATALAATAGGSGHRDRDFGGVVVDTVEDLHGWRRELKGELAGIRRPPVESVDDGTAARVLGESWLWPLILSVESPP